MLGYKNMANQIGVADATSQAQNAVMKYLHANPEQTKNVWMQYWDEGKPFYVSAFKPQESVWSSTMDSAAAWTVSPVAQVAHAYKPSIRYNPNEGTADVEGTLLTDQLFGTPGVTAGGGRLKRRKSTRKGTKQRKRKTRRRRTKQR